MNQRKGGAILAYIGIGIKLTVAIFFTPFLILSLGKSEYGIFNIVGSLTSYLAILDFGINDSTIRYLVRARNSKNSEEKNEIINSIFILYSVVGIIILFVGIAVFSNLETFFANSFSNREIYLIQKVFIISGLSIVITIALNPITAILVAYEQFILVKTIEISSYLLTTATIVCFLMLGYNVIAVVLISAIINLLGLGLKLWYVIRKMKIRFNILGYSSNYIKQLLSYATPIFVVVFVEQIYWKLDNIIIGAKLGASAVAVYAVGLFFQKYLLSFSTSISRVLIPKITLEIENNNDELIISFIQIARYQLLIVLLIILGLIFFGKGFINLWLGEDFESAYYVLFLILVPFSFEIVGNIRNTILQVKELYWYRSVLILFISLINVVLTIVFLNQYGIIGAAFFTGTGLFLGYIGSHFILHKFAGINFFSFIKAVWGEAVKIIIICSLSAFLINYINSENWAILIAKVFVFSFIYILAIWKLYLRDNEKNTFIKIANFIF